MSPHSVAAQVISASELRHQLRTPLNHIVGYSEILLDERPGPDGEERLNSILAEANLLLDAVQQAAGGDQTGVTAAALLRLRERIAGGIGRVQQSARDLRSVLKPENYADLERIDAAAASMLNIVPGPGPSLVPAPRTTETQFNVLTGPGRILVVDDNDLNRDMLSRQLEGQRHEVATAPDGEIALRMLHERHFDIVLLDLMMPGIDGFGVLRAIRGDPAFAGVAVILVSALDEMENVVRSIEAGAEDYLFKPVNPTLLRARIKSTLDKLRAEEAVRRKQRLESIGLLASGVAHDFNNLLTSIIGHAQLLGQVLVSEEDRAMASSIVDAGERAAELTRQLLAYSGKGMFRMEAVNLPALIGDTEVLMRASLPRRTRLAMELNDVPPVTADKNQLRQSLLNLVLNAAESIGSEVSGVVTIETGVEHVDAFANFDVMPDAPTPGPYAWVQVADTGCGMNAETAAKMFEPFFTTKFMGRGLGLAAVAGIVRSHKGLIKVRSAPGKGSALRIYFPATAAARTGSPPAHPFVLVVDDEPVVRQIAKVALERRGWKVLVAESGDAAIGILRDDLDEIDIVLLDWKMPGMDGAETMTRLREIKPELKVIVSSGFAQAEAEETFRKSPISGYLQKPYKMSDLAALIEKNLPLKTS